MASADIPAIYHFHGMGSHLETDEVFRAQVKAGAKKFETMDGAIVFTGSDLFLPADLDPMAAAVILPAPQEEEYRSLLGSLLRDLGQRQYIEVNLSKEETAGLLKHLSGLTLMEAEKILTKAIIEDDCLTPRHQARHRGKEGRGGAGGPAGVLPCRADHGRYRRPGEPEGMARQAEERGGESAESRGIRAFLPQGGPASGCPGMWKEPLRQGCGLRVGTPLLKFDTSNLYNKYIGESEKNFKRAIRAAERMAPVSLDRRAREGLRRRGYGGRGRVPADSRELPDLDAGPEGRRIYRGHGQRNRAAPSGVPPEGPLRRDLLRRPPGPETRREIFRIHLASRGQDPGAFDLDSLAEETEGFTGSEIEEVVVSGLYTAFSEDQALTSSDLVREVRSTVPLSVTMEEKISALRAWASSRTVRAN